MFRYSKVTNEYEFPPQEVLHQLLITSRLGRHFKGEVCLTKRGAELADAPARLFAELIAACVGSVARLRTRPIVDSQTQPQHGQRVFSDHTLTWVPSSTTRPAGIRK
jgi:hypothetical protein